MARPARTRRSDRLALVTEWRTGPRTAAWDALWRRIFSEALADSVVSESTTEVSRLDRTCDADGAARAAS